MVDELKRMFSFLELINGETKTEYKARIRKRGTEILNGINCTLEETINLKALYETKATIITFNGKIIHSDLSKDEYDYRKGNARDYEKYVYSVFFGHLDEEEFLKKKSMMWDKYLKMYEKNNEDDFYDETHSFYMLLEDEKLEEQYGERQTRENISKVISLTKPKK